MTKHRFRESIKSFFGHHIDPEKDEQLKGSKIEMDDKVTKMLKLLKDEVEDNDGIPIANSKKEPLVQLMEDFHKHYQNLYEQYDHLTGELRKKAHGKWEKDGSSSSSSDSESDNSSKVRSSKNGNLESEFQKRLAGVRQELETANLEIVDLKRKLTAISEEKEALNSEYLSPMNKVREAEEVVSNLKLESERSECERTKLVAENEELRHRLDSAGKVEAEMIQRLEDLSRERDKFILEKEIAAKRIKDGEKFTEDLRCEVDRLKKENITLKQEVETVRGEVSNMQQQLESAEKHVSELTDSLSATMEENKSLNSKLSEASNEIQQAQNTIQQLMGELSQSKEKVGERDREILTLKELHEVQGNQSSAKIQELEAHLTSLEMELASLQAANRDMALQVETKKTEAERLGEQNTRLLSQISELEIMAKEREEEFFSLTKKFEDNEKESLSRVENLNVLINNLVADMDSLRSQKAQLEEHMVFKNDEASTQVKSLMDQINTLQQELESMHSQKAELEVQLERKTQDNSDFEIEIEKAKEEILSKTRDQQRVLQEKEGLLAQRNDMEFEIRSIKDQKGELEEELRTKIEENGQLREEMAGLQGQIFEVEKTLTEKGLEITALQEKISELQKALSERGLEFTALQEKHASVEKTLAERGLEFTALQEKHASSENETSSQLTALAGQVNNLQQELDSLQAQRNELELQLEREKHEATRRLTEMESQINNQQTMLEEQEESYKKLAEEYKQVEGLYQERKANLEVAERKIQEMSEEHDKKALSKNQIVADLEQTVEDLKRELDMKGDDINTLVEKVRTIEVKLRLSDQKLRVTEQLLTENEESFRNAEAKFLDERRTLEEKVMTLSGIIAANHEAHCIMITDISGTVNNTLTGFEAVIKKLEERYGSYEQCIKETSKELRIAKHWFSEAKNETKRLTVEVTNLTEQLKHKKEQEIISRERAEKLQIKARKEESEKENLLKTVTHLEKKVELMEIVMKEKDQGILDLGEEKREAIRQLCLWIEYHRSRCDDLKEIISKRVRVQRAT